GSIPPVNLETKELDIKLLSLGFVENPQNRYRLGEWHGFVCFSCLVFVVNAQRRLTHDSRAAAHDSTAFGARQIKRADGNFSRKGNRFRANWTYPLSSSGLLTVSQSSTAGLLLASDSPKSVETFGQTKPASRPRHALQVLHAKQLPQQLPIQHRPRPH